MFLIVNIVIMEDRRWCLRELEFIFCYWGFFEINCKIMIVNGLNEGRVDVEVVFYF